MKKKLDVVKIKILLLQYEEPCWNDDGDRKLSLFKTLNYIFERETGNIFGNKQNRTSKAKTSEANYHTIGNFMPEMLARLGLNGNYEAKTQKIEIIDKAFELDWELKNSCNKCVELEYYQITTYFDNEIQEIHRFVPVIEKLEYDTVEIDEKEEGE